MVSEKFRHQLRKEAKRWQAEDLINDKIYQQLALRYEFESLDTAASNRFIAILLGLGAILLGLAAITFVAANWQIFSKEVKVLLLMSIFAIANISGFYLWRHPLKGWRSRLGEALLLLGGLIIGANIGLMSQIFHQSGPVYQLFLVWGAGVLLMAASLRLTSLGILAIILTAIGYSWGIQDLYYIDEFSLFRLSLLQMPVLVSLIFVPLAYWCKSRWIFALSALLVTFSFPVNLSFGVTNFSRISPILAGLVFAAAAVIPAALLWAYRDRFWLRHWRGIPHFDKIARNIAIFSLSTVFYWSSFNYVWRDRFFSEVTAKQVMWQEWLTLLNLIIFAVLAILAWWQLGYSYKSRSTWKIDLDSTLVGSAIAVTGLGIFWQTSIYSLGAIATVTFNLFLFLLAIFVIRNSLSSGKRLGFWWGIAVIAIQILSRMLEYNTGLMFKAIVLFACGAAIIAAGIWFEKYLKRELEKDPTEV